MGDARHPWDPDTSPAWLRRGLWTAAAGVGWLVFLLLGGIALFGGFAPAMGALGLGFVTILVGLGMAAAGVVGRAMRR